MQQTLHNTLMQKTHKNLTQVCVNLWPGPPLALFCEFLVSSYLSAAKYPGLELDKDEHYMEIYMIIFEV
jgi:hypothetical protein